MEVAALTGEGLVLAYQATTVVHGVSIGLRRGAVVALVGPNGSGKSTVLRSLARLHRLGSGTVRVERRVESRDKDGSAAGAMEDAAPLSAKDFARRVTLLSQSRPSPSGLAVRDVVAFGRHPHRRRFAALSIEDREKIDRAMSLTGLGAMADRAVDQLSGGELQRVWLATCLAQDTAVVLLDEPTNHLDLRYQVEILDLLRDLADEHDTAIGVVLHDLNQAALVADEVVLLDGGTVRVAGVPADVLTGEHLSEVYGLPVEVALGNGLVRVDPRGRIHHRRRSPAKQPERNP
jgi:iron-chelate-transporting ATPase